MEKKKPKNIDMGVSAEYELSVREIFGCLTIEGIPLQVLMKKLKKVRSYYPNRKVRIHFRLPIQYDINGGTKT